jgi:hypothetical protein
MYFLLEFNIHSFDSDCIVLVCGIYEMGGGGGVLVECEEALKGQNIISESRQKRYLVQLLTFTNASARNRI